MDNLYIRYLIRDAFAFTHFLGDYFGTHRVEVLVSDEQREAYLRTLDADYNPNTSDKASWFKGQQIFVDIDGTHRDWDSRSANEVAFQEL